MSASNDDTPIKGSLESSLEDYQDGFISGAFPA